MCQARGFLTVFFLSSGTVWVASLPATVKGKGCCFILGSLTFSSLTGEEHMDPK